MRSRIQPWFTIVLALMAIGLVSMLMNGGAQNLIIPLTIVAIVYLLYKFPPDRWRKPRYRGYAPSRNRGPQPLRTTAKTAKRKASPFTVIEGRKNKEDEPPRYH